MQNKSPLNITHTKKKLVILTLQKHQASIWITRLVAKLHELLPNESVQCHVLVLETCWDDFPIGNNDFLLDWIGVVNRISDAAEPVQVKMCLSILHAAELQGIPVFNGARAFTSTANKWNHHVLFHTAQLQTPYSVLIHQPTPTKLMDAVAKNTSLRFPLLLKPNSGGFGAGIRRYDSTEDIMQDHYDPSDISNDCMALLQNCYTSPIGDRFYRVWFLMGRVQCAVERSTALPNPPLVSPSSSTPSFSGPTCMACLPGGSICQPWQAWTIPDAVRFEIENSLLPLLPDAHAGSVEFFYTNEGNEGAKKCMYFDFNLLSTLPLEMDTESWTREPWEHLASCILDYCGIKDSSTN